MSWGTQQWGSQWSGDPFEGLSNEKQLATAKSLFAAYSVGPGTTPRVMTRSNTTTSYRTGLVVGSLGGGASIIQQFRNLSKTPDLAASISGFAFYDLFVSIFGASFGSQIGGTIRCIVPSYYDFSGRIVPFDYRDLPVSISSVLGVDISASIYPIFSDLLGLIGVVPPKNLSAFIGTHLPVDLQGIISSVLPSNISANIRGYLFGPPKNLEASITPSGGYFNLVGRIRAGASSFSSLAATLVVREPKDIGARIAGIIYSDLLGYIQSNYAAPDFRAMIKPNKSVFNDIFSWVRPSRSGTVDLSGYTRNVVSTHTSSKVRNIDSFPRRFKDNKYVIGTLDRGVIFLTIEPIFGAFPDMGGRLVAIPLSKSNIGGFVRVCFTSTSSTSASVSSVTPRINISRVQLNYVLFRSLWASTVPSGGYLNLRTSIKSQEKGVTGTDSNAGYTYIKSTTAQFIATTRGLLVLPQVTTKLKVQTYVNNHPRPDLHAYLYGWAESSLAASIRVYHHSSLPTTLNVLDINHLRDFYAVVRSVTPYDLGFSITATGGYSNLGVSIASQFEVKELQTKIIGYFGVLGKEVIAIHTKPFSDFAVSINFDSRYACSILSGYYGLGAFIAGFATTFSDVPTTITALHNKFDMPVFISGLKRIRLNILDLYFRTTIRDSESIYTTIKGWKRESPYDIITSIVGVSHEADLPTSITARRFKPSYVVTAADVLLVDLNNPSNTVTAEVLFNTGVDRYIYDSGTLSLYSEDTEQVWSILVRRKGVQPAFFDQLPGLNSIVVNGLSDYDSFDEAIRASLNYLVDYYSNDVLVSISATGGMASLPVKVNVSTLDRVSDMRVGVYPVYTIPDLQTYIAAVGGYISLYSSVKSIEMGSFGLSSSIVGWGESDFSVVITAV